MRNREEANEISEAYAELQRSRAFCTRCADASCVVIFATALIFVFFAVFFLPQRSYSESENRYLARLDKLDVFGAIKSGSFGEQVGDIMCDQFPARDVLIAVKAITEICALRGENNGILLGKNGALIARLEYSEAEMGVIRENLNAIESFRSEVENSDIEFTFAVAPRGIDVFAGLYPFGFSPERSKGALKAFSDADCLFLSKVPEYAIGSSRYKTDHHWTSLGAYYAYTDIARSLGVEPYGIESFRREILSDKFYGTSYSKSGFYFVGADVIEAFFFEGDARYCVTDGESGELIMQGLYDFERLAKKDKYSVFLGGDRGHIKISNGEDKPRLLVIKDSYFNSLAPFLCRHFELDVIDLRYFSGSTAKYAAESGADKILLLCGVDSLATAKTFTALRY